MLDKVNKVVALESILKDEEQVELGLTHTFSNGIYLREMSVPKDSLIVGKRHREDTINMLIKGSMTIIDGDETFTISAPYTFVSSKYSKKAGFAHEDSVWVNVHKTDSKDLEEIEKQFIISEEEYMQLEHKDKKCLG